MTTPATSTAHRSYRDPEAADLIEQVTKQFCADLVHQVSMQDLAYQEAAKACGFRRRVAREQGRDPEIISGWKDRVASEKNAQSGKGWLARGGAGESASRPIAPLPEERRQLATERLRIEKMVFDAVDKALKRGDVHQKNPPPILGSMTLPEILDGLTKKINQALPALTPPMPEDRRDLFESLMILTSNVPVPQGEVVVPGRHAARLGLPKGGGHRARMEQETREQIRPPRVSRLGTGIDALRTYIAEQRAKLESGNNES